MVIQLTNQIKNIPQAKDKSILDYRHKTGRKMVSIRLFLRNNRSLDEPITTEWSEKLWLLSRNFLHNQPEIDLIRPEFSTACIRKMINRIVSFFILCLVLCYPYA